METDAFGEWLDKPLRDAIGQAGGQRGLGGEIGALRIVLARLLLEEDDLALLVTGVTRLSSGIVQAARAQHAMNGGDDDALFDFMGEILAELRSADGNQSGQRDVEE